MTVSDELLDEIRAVVMRAVVPGIRLVGVDGPAGAGKSTIATQLSTRFGWPVIEIDDFFSWVSFTNWWPRLDAEVIAPLLDGRDARYRVRDWSGDEFGEGLAGWKQLWVDAAASDRLERGVARDGESHRGLWERYLPREAEFFAADGTATRADVRVDSSSR